MSRPRVRLLTLLPLTAAAVLGGASVISPAVAQEATYAPGSQVRLAAHVAGYDGQLAVVPVAGLTRAQATAAVVAAESSAQRRSFTLVTAPVHGAVGHSTMWAASVLARPGAVRLTDPGTRSAGGTGGAAAYVTTIRLGLDPVKVRTVARRLTRAATVVPKNATARLGRGTTVALDRGYNGSTLDATRLPRAIVVALAHGGAVVPEKPVQAHYGAATLTKVIVVHTATNRLTLFVRGRAAHTYVVATGQAGYPSPHGSFHVIARQGAPSWYNPHDDWSRNLPDVIGPGPDNPLGTRALQLDSPGILIHGIPQEENATLGRNASHGCVRMSRAEIERLYPQIPVGTPVLLVR